MALGIPEPLKKEHKELHSELVKGLSAGGATEENAKALAELLHPHFIKKEEEFALPLLDCPNARAARCQARAPRR